MFCLKIRYHVGHSAIKQSASSTRLLTMILYAYHFSSMCKASPTNLIFLKFITSIIASKEYNSGNSSLHNINHYFDTSAPLGPNISLSNLFSNTHCQYSSFAMMDQNSHPYTTDNTTLLYNSVFIFLNSKCQDKILRAAGIHKFNMHLGYPFFWKMTLLHHWVFAAKLWRQCSGLKTQGTKTPVTLYHIPKQTPHPNLLMCSELLHACNSSLPVLTPNSHFKIICYIYVVTVPISSFKPKYMFRFLSNVLVLPYLQLKQLLCLY